MQSTLADDPRLAFASKNSYRATEWSTVPRAGLVWRLRAKSKGYQPTAMQCIGQCFGRLVSGIAKLNRAVATSYSRPAIHDA
ncbi:MAG: hypothetical protein AB7Q01_02405 [Gammaproteobacteria bacterium]